MSADVGAGPFAPPARDHGRDRTPVPTPARATVEEPLLRYLRTTAGPKLVVGGILMVYAAAMLANEGARAHALPGQALLTLGLFSMAGMAGVFGVSSAVATFARPARATRWALTAELRFWQLLGSFALLLVVLVVRTALMPA